MPSWCEGDVNSSITPDHIIPKEVGSVDAHYDLRPAGRVGTLEGNLDGEVPDEGGGRDVAPGGDLGDALLQALRGESGVSPALRSACCRGQIGRAHV